MLRPASQVKCNISVYFSFDSGISSQYANIYSPPKDNKEKKFTEIRGERREEMQEIEFWEFKQFDRVQVTTKSLLPEQDPGNKTQKIEKYIKNM